MGSLLLALPGKLIKKDLRKLLLSSHPTLIGKDYAPFWSSRRTEIPEPLEVPCPLLHSSGLQLLSSQLPPKCHWLEFAFQAFILTMVQNLMTTMVQNHGDHHVINIWLLLLWTTLALCQPHLWPLRASPPPYGLTQLQAIKMRTKRDE